MHLGNASAASASLRADGTATEVRWNSATPYLTGGILLIMLLIGFALIVLFCQDRRRSAEARSPAPAGEKLEEGARITNAFPSALPEFVVITAGDNTPTYLATPAVVVSSSPEAVAIEE